MVKNRKHIIPYQWLYTPVQLLHTHPFSYSHCLVSPHHVQYCKCTTTHLAQIKATWHNLKDDSQVVGPDPIPRRKDIWFQTWWLSGSSSKKNMFDISVLSLGKCCEWTKFVQQKINVSNFFRISSFLRKPDRCPACMITFHAAAASGAPQRRAAHVLVFQWEPARRRTTGSSHNSDDMILYSNTPVALFSMPAM